MFITKTINESADMDLEQFDLVDSICESYEDLLSFNEALARFDIKEQELIHTESADLDAFREEAMEKAKKILNNFITKLKTKWSKFLVFINKQIIKYFDDNIKSFIKNNTEIVNELNNLIKEHYSTDDLHKYFSIYVVKGKNVVDLINFVCDMNSEVYNCKFRNALELGYDDERIKKEMQRNIPKEFTDAVKHNIGEFVNTRDINSGFLPLYSIENFKDASKMLHGFIDKSDGIFESMVRNAENYIRYNKKSSFNTVLYNSYYNWLYINVLKIYNIYISMCRKYFISLVSSVKRMANDINSDK